MALALTSAREQTVIMQGDMQQFYAMQPTPITPPAATETASRQHFTIFPELAFVRLTDRWVQSRRDAGLWGGNSFDGKIFRQFQIKDSPAVTVDFWYRGRKLSSFAAIAFNLTLRYVHLVNHMELDLIREVLGIVGTGVGAQRTSVCIAQIQKAEVGNLNGKKVLAIRWTNLKLKRQFISLFIDAEGDGATVHEIHFSTPPEQFAEHEAQVNELFRSMQWARPVCAAGWAAA